MLLIKSTLAGVFHEEKVCEYYGCLKIVIQVHLHVVFLYYFSLNMHHLIDSIYI